MAEQPIGISFMPSADAAAQNPQGGSQGQGGSDLAEAFKILNLHLPRVLGAAAIAPKRLLNASGSAGLMGMPGGDNPYAQVFQALLQSIAGGMTPGGTPSLSSLLGTNDFTVPGLDSGGGVPTDMSGSPSSDPTQNDGTPPPPRFVPGKDFKPIVRIDPPTVPDPIQSEDRGETYSTRYI
jgi:hypothetical protein